MEVGRRRGRERDGGRETEREGEGREGDGEGGAGGREMEREQRAEGWEQAVVGPGGKRRSSILRKARLTTQFFV